MENFTLYESLLIKLDIILIEAMKTDMSLHSAQRNEVGYGWLYLSNAVCLHDEQMNATQLSRSQMKSFIYT